jgi:hypothetical protein
MNMESDYAQGEVDQEFSLHHECLAVLSGNASVDGASHRGWFVGHFLADTCGLRATRLVEVKWGACSAGEERPSWGRSEQATTLCILLKGRVQFSFPREACKRQEESEPSATVKLSHLLSNQPVRTMSPASVNSGESESSHLP